MLEATTLGAGFLAGLALGTWSSDDEVMATLAAGAHRAARRDRSTATVGSDACRRAAGWIPELSSLDF